MSWIEEVEDSKYRVIHLSGRLDGASATEFEKSILPTLEDSSYPNYVILDMEKLEYVSSAGLRVILIVGKTVRATQGKLVLVGLQPLVHDIFEVSGFLTLFPVADSVEKAKEVN